MTDSLDVFRAVFENTHLCNHCQCVSAGWCEGKTRQTAWDF